MESSYNCGIYKSNPSWNILFNIVLHIPGMKKNGLFNKKKRKEGNLESGRLNTIKVIIFVKLLEHWS